MKVDELAEHLTERCKANRDGECSWLNCPQVRDNEPATTGRSCPRPWWFYEEDANDEIHASILTALRSYGLACAMKEREQCLNIIENANQARAADHLIYEEKETFYAGTMAERMNINTIIRARPSGNDLMKELEE